MSTLLQINTSLFSNQGQSSQLAEQFVDAWRAKNPGARVIVRDLSCVLIDDIQYQLPFGWIGRLAGRWLVQRKLHRLFDYRHRVTKQACEGDASRPSIKNRSENLRLLEARRFSSR